MNVYDFDKTITYEDSSYRFVKYALLRYPRVFKDCLEGIVYSVLRFAFSKDSDPTEMKEQLFGFVRYIPDIDRFVDEYWKANRCNIRQWYLERKQSTDIIISASPEFLVAPMAEEFGVNLIATPMNKYSGSIQGVNCKGEEKVRRFYAEFPDAAVDEFYSDSISDAPMARLAKRAYLVTGERIIPWPQY